MIKVGDIIKRRAEYSDGYFKGKLFIATYVNEEYNRVDIRCMETGDEQTEFDLHRFEYGFLVLYKNKDKRI